MTKRKPKPEAIELGKDEISAFGILNSTVVTQGQVLAEAQAARQAFVELLGIKYHAKYEAETGAFIPIEGDADAS